MRSLARWVTLPLLGAPLGSWALTLGEIEAGSYLNQPLYAEIPISATQQELAGLDVALAPLARFTANGLERPGFLSSLEFDVVTNAAGRNVIRVTSAQSITEPFVTLIIEARLPNGTQYKQYTVLLDPPVFLPNAPAEPVTPPVSRAPSTGAGGGAIERPPLTPPVTETEPAPAVGAVPPAASPVGADGAEYTVQGGDTLWAVASAYRPAGVSMNQAMIAIFEVNASAFDGNINRLRRGAILRIPPAADFGAVSAAAATDEVARQTAAWAGESAASPQLVLLTPSDEPGASSGAAAGNAAAAAASEAEIGALRDQVRSLEEQIAERDRLLEIRNAELSDLQNRLDQAPAAAVEPEPGLEPELAAEPASAAELESEQLFVDEAEPAEPAPAEPAAAEAAAEPAESAARTPPAPPAPAEPTLVDRMIGVAAHPFFWIGSGALVAVLAALAFLRRRRDSLEDVTGQWEALEAEVADESGDDTASIRVRAPEPDMVVVEGHRQDAAVEEPAFAGTHDFGSESGAFGADELDSGTAEFAALDSGTAEIAALDELASTTSVDEEADATELADQTLSNQTVINLDQADPIAEADFHMAYGLYDQAADLIVKALAADPNDRALKLKLLEVYFVWGNKEQFLERAQMLHQEVGERGSADWDKVVIMGKQICPDEPLFAQATAAAGEVDLDLASGTSESGGLDFAFDEAESDEFDLDLGGDGELSLETGGEQASADEELSDEELSDQEMLDIGARTQAGIEAALLEDTDDEGGRTSPGDLDYDDLDSTQESPTVETPAGSSDGDWGSVTVESLTVDAAGPEAPTVETPTIQSPGPDAQAGDTVEHVRPSAAPSTADMTAELELDDLGLDISDIENLPDDLGDLPSRAEAGDRAGSSGGSDEDILSATGVTHVIQEGDVEDDDLTQTGTAVLDEDEEGADLESDTMGIQTEVLEQSVASHAPEPVASEEDLDLNFDDFSSALDGGATAEQPGISSYGVDLDLDVGVDVPADDEPTGTEAASLDPQTMTEVGTKLDLARAYIDMGDPEGAKSILEEVLSEGDSGQRSEAQALIDALPAA